MRPDKKKNRHHDSKKKAAAAKERDAASSSGATAAPKRRPVPVRENEDTSVTSDHSSEEREEEQGVDPKFARRNISSNWTKYEIPSSDDDDEGRGEGEEGVALTGRDFNAVIKTAGSGTTFFRLKAEKEWDEDTGLFQNDFFALDLKHIEAAVATIPLHEQIELRECDINESTRAMLTEKALLNKEKFQSMYSSSSSGVVFSDGSDINKTILESLKGRKEVTPQKKEQEKSNVEKLSKLDISSPPSSSKPDSKTKSSEVSKDGGENNVEELEDWLDDFLDD